MRQHPTMYACKCTRISVCHLIWVNSTFPRTGSAPRSVTRLNGTLIAITCFARLRTTLITVRPTRHDGLAGGEERAHPSWRWRYKTLVGPCCPHSVSTEAVLSAPSLGELYSTLTYCFSSISICIFIFFLNGKNQCCKR